MICPKCKNEMLELVFLYICNNCDLALTEEEINNLKGKHQVKKWK